MHYIGLCAMFKVADYYYCTITASAEAWSKDLSIQPYNCDGILFATTNCRKQFLLTVIMQKHKPRDLSIFTLPAYKQVKHKQHNV